MLDMTTYWPVTLGIGIGVFLTRYSFILVLDKITLPPMVQRMLRYIPASVLPALIAPAILLHSKTGTISFAGWDQLAAGITAILIAWKTRNMLATIASGMIVLWLAQLFL
ncbi:AzlD domain-containing protein [Pseudodesulfovibrio sp. JC047]|uniref:AzlD domain-containing protein n=1 Tax=Pseudodesulfovibrio sp. JC047 TaxID=2683199 RepID=UPI0013D119EE|nr:AzlD domain-containing protein [Pseudodesulfovibrio sp. JC047]NDV20770.1 AzlD domain-containing protein [Pseudodesulfovibrio sp. JC047]